MNSTTKFWSTDTQVLQNGVSKVATKKNASRVLMIIGVVVVVLVAAVIALAYFLLSVLGSDAPEKNSAATKIQDEYSVFTVPPQFEAYAKEPHCTAALDSCDAYVTYKYNYNNTISEANAEASLRASFQNQGVTFNANSVGTKNDLSIVISKPTDTTIPTGKDQLQVVVSQKGK